jgi:hypothetical protein
MCTTQTETKEEPVASGEESNVKVEHFTSDTMLHEQHVATNQEKQDHEASPVTEIPGGLDEALQVCCRYSFSEPALLILCI